MAKPKNAALPLIYFNTTCSLLSIEAFLVVIGEHIVNVLEDFVKGFFVVLILNEVAFFVLKSIALCALCIIDLCKRFIIRRSKSKLIVKILLKIYLVFVLIINTNIKTE